MCVFGTRPEAIKMCPLVHELKNDKNIHTVVCVSGQHRQMLEQVLDAFDIAPDHDLKIMKEKQDLFDITVGIMQNIKEVLTEEKPDIVLVHGDTSTAFVTALACYYMKIPVGHVEAGLRTYDIYSPFPEEFNREAIDLITAYHFAPTKLAENNLLRENKSPESITVTGNTAIDALKITVKENYSHPILEWAEGSRLILITAHRRESFGEPMRRMFRAIKRVVEDSENVKAVYPMHLNPAVRKTASEILDGCDDIMLTEPMDVVDFHNVMARSYIILTDSGGIQEEAPALKKPVLVMREVTERQEGVEAGVLKLVGTEEENIYEQCMLLLNDKDKYNEMLKNDNPYGDGTASKKIADILRKMSLQK